MSEKVHLSDIAELMQVQELEERILVSEAAKPFGNDDELKRKTLPPLVWFYIWTNAVLFLSVFGFAFLEFHSGRKDGRIITDKVIIALVSGSTIQLAAIIVAAFKGLFSKQ